MHHPGISTIFALPVIALVLAAVQMSTILDQMTTNAMAHTLVCYSWEVFLFYVLMQGLFAPPYGSDGRQRIWFSTIQIGMFYKKGSGSGYLDMCVECHSNVNINSFNVVSMQNETVSLTASVHTHFYFKPCIWQIIRDPNNTTMSV